MKKILATVLALTMIVGMSIPAFATAISTGTSTIGITATYNKKDAVESDEVVYSIDVDYTSLAFTYTVEADTKKWNPNDLDFTTIIPGEDASWDKANAVVTITNRSNASLAIEAEASEGFTVVVSNEGACASAVGASDETLPKVTLTVTPPASIAKTTSATVTVTIA